MIVLIIASSGRMLAEAASNCGIRAVVVDLFADADTGRFTERLLQTPSLSVSAIAPILDDLLAQFSFEGLIYGSGLENHPETLAYLSERLTLLGNSAEVFTALLDKLAFFSKLDALKIPYPEVALTAPAIATGWLVKSMRGSGGCGIRWYDGATELKAFEYWQKYQQGKQYSVLLIANGVTFVTVGFHQQWTVEINDQPFIFSGIGHAQDLAQTVQQEVMRWAAALVSAYGLKGLNTIDFIDSQGMLSLLEINPRPSASMQLYADELLSMHIQACHGKLPLSIDRPSAYRCYQIIYAKHRVKIPELFTWPEACRDLPKAGSVIETGHPICSLLTVAVDKEHARLQLDDLHQMLDKPLCAASLDEASKVGW